MRRMPVYLLSVLVALGLAAGAAAGPATGSDDELGPDVVMLKELVNEYDPVPFSHRDHARMAEMWDGCVTCHHHTPDPQAAATQPAEERTSAAPRQADATAIPACKSCHQIEADDASIRMPNLKGAYHRQCLGCHREWTHSNSCSICHLPRDAARPRETEPTPGDIVGRMHPPIPAPDVTIYKTRFTPTAGPNVLFRHKQHTQVFGIRCVTCHRKDNCVQCHDGQAQNIAANGGGTSGGGGPRPLKPGKTWKDSHGPCTGCHQADRCASCHYRDDQLPPPEFRHAAASAQDLDEQHAKLACAACHPKLQFQAPVTCGDGKCHAPEKAIAYPGHKPGPVVTKESPVEVAQPEPATLPVGDKPIIVRIRR